MRRFVFSLLLTLACVALALPALANPHSKLVITTDRPTVVIVDGEYLEYIDGTTNVEKRGITAGRHVVEFKNLVGKPLGEIELNVPSGGPVEVRARWVDKEFELVDTIFVEAPEPAVVVVESYPAGHDSVSVSIDGMGVGVSATAGTTTTTTTSSETVSGGLYGHGVEVTTTETTETVTVGGHGGGVVVVHDDHQEARPASRNVTFRVTDDSWANVYIDGKLVYEPRAMADEKTISLSTGEHHIEVKDFMDNDVWCRGTLVVDGWTDLIIGLAEESQIQVFNDSDAFIPR